MAIAFDAVNGQGAVGASSITFAHTVAAGGILLVGAATLGSAQTVASVTYDGVGLTPLQAMVDDSGGTDTKNSLYGIHNPTTGSSKNVVVTFSAALGDAGAAHAISYTGVENSSLAAMHRAAFHAGGAGGGGDVTVTDSQNNDMVVAFCANLNSGPGPISAGSGKNSRRFDNAIDGIFAYGTEDILATGANQVMDFTTDDFCTNVAIALVPASGGGITAAQEAGIWAAMNSGGVIGRVDA